jgi:hypothetical protein
LRFFNEDSFSSNKRGTPILWAIAEINGMPALGVISVVDRSAFGGKDFVIFILHFRKLCGIITTPPEVHPMGEKSRFFDSFNKSWHVFKYCHFRRYFIINSLPCKLLFEDWGAT